MNNTLVFNPLVTNARFPQNLVVFWCFQLNFFDPFVPNAPSFYLLKTSESRGFLMFSGGKEGVRWEKMNELISDQCSLSIPKNVRKSLVVKKASK